MKRLSVLVVVLALFSACGEQKQSQAVFPSASTAPATWTQADLQAAHDYFGAHSEKTDGHWHSAIVLSSTITADQKHWYGVLVLETGEVKTCDLAANDDAQMALLVARGDLIRFKLSESYSNSVEGAFSTTILHKGVLFVSAEPGGR